MNIAVILAAGKGTRIKHADKPKQYLEIAGKPVLLHTVEKFLVCEQIDHIVITVYKDWLQYAKEIFSGYGQGKISVCEGGDNRQESLYQALIHCKNHLNVPDDAIILSHDAARPFVTSEIINANLLAIQEASVVTTVIPAVDTIIQSTDGRIIAATTIRSHMYQVQTPQTFYLSQYLDVYQNLGEEVVRKSTDVAGIFHQYGLRVILVQGNKLNFKITTQEDFILAESLLSGSSERS